MLDNLSVKNFCARFDRGLNLEDYPVMSPAFDIETHRFVGPM